MKIALCLSGHLRAFEQTYSSFKTHILNIYNPDIFIHTWDKLGFSCAYKSDRTLNNTNSKESIVKKLYNPKKMIIEDSNFIEHLKLEANQYAPHLTNVPKHVGHMASMFYKIYACNEIRKQFELENEIKYDYIIRCRPDLMFNTPLTLPPLEQNTVYIPQHISGAGWYTDQFAISDPDSMDLYSSLYFDMPEYFMAKMEFYPEKFVFWGLNKKSLITKFIDINFHILR